MRETPALARLVAATLFIEQPIKRAAALTKPVDALARLKPLIIDESDGELASFPAALALGYSGVSSKNCKGLYKSILNAARVAKLNAEAGAARVLHVGRGPHHAGGRQRAAGPGAGLAAGADPRRAQRPSLHRRHVVRAGSASRRTSPAPTPISTSAPTGPARLRITDGQLALGVARLPRLRGWRRTWISRPCGRCRPRRQARITPAHPEKAQHERAAPARALRHRGRARGFPERADAGAGRRPRQGSRRHPRPRRRRQDGADAGAHGQAGGAGQARRRRGALLRSRRAHRPGGGRASRPSPAICSTAAPSRPCRSSPTSSTWPP